VLNERLAAFEADLTDRVALVVEDRALDGDLHALLAAIRTQAGSLDA
jgi:histidine ammonia-lyase